MSTIRFSGVWSDRRFLEAANRLQQWIEDEDLSILDPFKYGYQSDPFTPAFLRRNEVLVPVIGRGEDFSAEQSSTIKAQHDLIANDKNDKIK